MKLFTTIAAAALVAGSMASAATFDFAADAELFFNKNGYEGTFDQVYGENADAQAAGTNGGNMDGGVTVEAYAFDDSDRDLTTNPFMDSRGNGDGDDLAGLGVCSSGFDFEEEQSSCSTNYDGDLVGMPGDDNLLYSEVLELVFDAAVEITSLFIRDAGHDPITAVEAIWINFEFYSAVNGYVDLTGLEAFGGGDETVYYISSASSCLPSGDDAQPDAVEERDCALGQELYISALSVSEIPLPAAGLMLLAGLGGLGAMRRRKKA